MALWFLLLFVAETILLIAISVPLMQGRVKPNSIYGVRTAKTLSDESVWYRSNAYGGRLLFRTGLVQLVAVVALYCIPSLRANFVAYNLACGGVILGGLLLASVLLMRFIRSL
jgi:SdpI/YfhL protein family